MHWRWEYGVHHRMFDKCGKHETLHSLHTVKKAVYIFPILHSNIVHNRIPHQVYPHNITSPLLGSLTQHPMAVTQFFSLNTFGAASNNTMRQWAMLLAMSTCNALLLTSINFAFRLFTPVPNTQTSALSNICTIKIAALITSAMFFTLIRKTRASDSIYASNNSTLEVNWC